jgi:heme A synthase
MAAIAAALVVIWHTSTHERVSMSRGLAIVYGLVFLLFAVGFAIFVAHQQLAEALTSLGGILLLAVDVWHKSRIKP